MSERRELIAHFVRELLNGNKGAAKKLLSKFVHHHSKQLLADEKETEKKDD